MISHEETTRVDLQSECRDWARRARVAARQMGGSLRRAKDAWLLHSAEALKRRSSEILEANARDVALASDQGLSSAAIDRLTLNPKRIEEMARGLHEVAALPDPIGEVVSSS